MRAARRGKAAARKAKKRRVFAKRTVPMRAMTATDGTGGDPCGAQGQGCRAGSHKRRRVFAKRTVPMRAMIATDGADGDPCGAVGDICDGRHMGFARGRIRSGTPMLLQKGGARNSNRKDGGARGMRGIHRRFIRS